MLPGVATETGLIYVLRRSFGRIENLADIAAAVDVCFARAMAALAGRSVAMFQRNFGMRISAEFFCHFFMAGCASLGTYKVRGCGRGGMASGSFRARSCQRVGAQE